MRKAPRAPGEKRLKKKLILATVALALSLGAFSTWTHQANACGCACFHWCSWLTIDIEQIVSWAEQNAYNIYKKVRDDIRAGAASSSSLVGYRTQIKGYAKVAQAKADAHWRTRQASDTVDAVMSGFQTPDESETTTDDSSSTAADGSSDSSSSSGSTSTAATGTGSTGSGSTTTASKPISSSDIVCQELAVGQVLRATSIFAEALRSFLTSSTHQFFNLDPLKCTGPSAGNHSGGNCGGPQVTSERVAVAQNVQSEDPNSDPNEESTVWAGSYAKLPEMTSDTNVLFKRLEFVPEGADTRSPQGNYNSAGQWLYLNALEVCYRLGGNVPQDPVGTQLDVPAGIEARTNNKKAKLHTNRLMSNCLDIVADHARPNCDVTGLQDLCDKQKKVCSNIGAMSNNTIDLSEFEYCNFGLSHAQMRKLAALTCIPMAYTLAKTTMPTSTSKDDLETAQKCNEDYINLLHEEEAARAEFEADVALYLKKHPSR